MKVSDLSSIHTGYTTRSRLETVNHGGLLAIQLGDLSPDGCVNPERLTRVRLGDLPDKYLVSAGDVVFRSRGERNTAFALDARFKEPALAVLPLFVLRPKVDIVLPEYLAWAINQPPAQRHFDIFARGTGLRMVPRSSFDALDIDVPDLETQRRIVSLDALAERERVLSFMVADKRRQLTSLLLAERAKAMHRD